MYALIFIRKSSPTEEKSMPMYKQFLFALNKYD